jgi:hypothetical protein
MAQRKSPRPGNSGHAGSPRSSTGRPGTRPSAATGKTGNRSTGATAHPRARQNKSIVNQRQTPWGLIITTIVIVLFAGAVIGVVIATHKNKSSASSSNCAQMTGNNSVSYLNKNVCAMAIKGVTFHPEANRAHIQGVIHYNTTPPVGGAHSQYWADCTGTVYPNAIANENAVHMLEHGAVWITYNKDKLSPAQVKSLASYVRGVDRMAMSPYPNLKSPISLQAWGYQLFVNSPSDPRIARFIAALKFNPETTPEYGVTCSDPSFIQHPSTFGHPLWVPASGGTGGTMSANGR